MADPKLTRESFTFDTYETIVRLHEEVMIENEKYHDSIPNFLFVLTLFQLNYLLNCLIKLYVFAKFKIEANILW